MSQLIDRIVPPFRPNRVVLSRSYLGVCVGAVLLTLTLLGGASGCDDTSSNAKSTVTASPPGAAAAEGSTKTPSSPGTAKNDQHVKEDSKANGGNLVESDFLESDSNRDPFRSHLSDFLTPQRRTAKIQRKVLLQRYSLDELQLIAVIAGRTRARAMFRDPAGLGVTVKRGDYLSKSAGRVKQILADKVIVEIQEQVDNGQSLADRVIVLHAAAEDAQ